jgi:hypothetical protein
MSEASRRGLGPTELRALAAKALQAATRQSNPVEAEQLALWAIEFHEMARHRERSKLDDD